MAIDAKPKTGAKAKTGKAALKLDMEEEVQSSDESDESVDKHSSNRKMASKSTKTSTTNKQPKPKAKSLPKDTPNRPKKPDPPTIDSDQVEVLKIIPPKIPSQTGQGNNNVKYEIL